MSDGFTDYIYEDIFILKTKIIDDLRDLVSKSTSGAFKNIDDQYEQMTIKDQYNITPDEEICLDDLMGEAVEINEITKLVDELSIVALYVAAEQKHKLIVFFHDKQNKYPNRIACN